MRAGLITALVVDEAQSLRPELLEEIRLLTNLETSQQKLLQIVLMGQPELDALLDSAELRQLKQRVALRCQLQPLDASRPELMFFRAWSGREQPRAADLRTEAFAKVYEYSRGIPRIINNALRKCHGERFCPRAAPR